jgi:hypothetical protein
MTVARQGLGAFFRTLLDFVKEKGLLEQVRAKVSDETREKMLKPPSPLSWMASKSIDEIQVAIGELAGRPLLVEFGALSARAFGGSMIQPVIRAAFLLFGETPAAAFANLDNFFTLATRGISFRWRQVTGKEGVVEARFAGADTPQAAFHVLQGSLQFVFEISGAKGGEIDPAEVVTGPDAGGNADVAIARYRVRWT